MTKIGAPAAWDITTGNPNFAVAVIDTGIDYTHPDLYLNIWINQGEIPSAIRAAAHRRGRRQLITFRDLNNPVNIGAGKITDLNGNGRIDGGDLLNNSSGWANGLDNDGNGCTDDLVGWDFVNNDNNPFDDNNHGTHVAGTIGAIGNNGVGVVGVNWSVSIVGLKFLAPTAAGPSAAPSAALNYAVAKGIKIIQQQLGRRRAQYRAVRGHRPGPDRRAHLRRRGRQQRDEQRRDRQLTRPTTASSDNVVAVAATDSTDDAGQLLQLRRHHRRPRRAGRRHPSAPRRTTPTAASAARRWRRRTSPARSRCLGREPDADVPAGHREAEEFGGPDRRASAIG